MKKFGADYVVNHRTDDLKAENIGKVALTLRQPEIFGIKFPSKPHFPDQAVQAFVVPGLPVCREDRKELFGME